MRSRVISWCKRKVIGLGVMHWIHVLSFWRLSIPLWTNNSAFLCKFSVQVTQKCNKYDLFCRRLNFRFLYSRWLKTLKFYWRSFTVKVIMINQWSIASDSLSKKSITLSTITCQQIMTFNLRLVIVELNEHKVFDYLV